MRSRILTHGVALLVGFLLVSYPAIAGLVQSFRGQVAFTDILVADGARNSSSSNTCSSTGSAAPALCLDDDVVVDGVLFVEETSAQTAEPNYGAIWTTTANELFFQDGAGVTHTVSTAEGTAPMVTFKSYAGNKLKGAGAHYIGGYYKAPSTEAALSEAGATQTLGAASDDEPWGAHAFVVCKGDGATDGSDLVLTVSGTSITDAGVRTDADSEVILADALLATCAADAYAETSKKWLGQITFTLSSTGGTAFNWSGNYGFAKYEDFGNRDFTVTDFECTGLSDADATIDIELLHHKTTAWTYSAAAFVPGGDVIVQMSTDLGTDVGLSTGENFAYKRAGLSWDVAGTETHGLIIRVTHGIGGDLDVLNCHIGVTL